MSEAIDKYGIVFVAAAGNNGPALCTLGTPPDIATDNIIGKFLKQVNVPFIILSLLIYFFSLLHEKFQLLHQMKGKLQKNKRVIASRWFSKIFL